MKHLPAFGCRHRPACPPGTATWRCSLRTDIELSVRSGFITREQGLRLLQKYRLPMSAPSTVYRGEPKPQEKFL